jgi:hypothetical protein
MWAHGNSNLRICGSIIKEPFILKIYEPLEKANVVHLPADFIVFVGPEKIMFTSVDDVKRIVFVGKNLAR